MTKNNPWMLLNNTINSKRCSAKHPFGFFWAIGKSGEYLLAIHHTDLDDWNGDKLKLSGIEIEQYQIEHGYRLVLKLHDNSDWDLFFNLCSDLLNATEFCKTEQEMLAIVSNRLQRWQKLFRKSGKKLLTSEEQQGLFGELYFIKQHLLGNYHESEVFSFWRGPLGEQQDFGIGNITVEVKTKRGTAVPYVQISSLEQLDCKSGYCYLYVVTLNASPAAVAEAKTLNDIVLEIKKSLENIDAIEYFESLLAEAGYIEISEYSETSYLVSRTEIFQIKASFPRLVPGDIKPGIHSVQYKIEIEACKPYIIASDEFNSRVQNEK